MFGRDYHRDRTYSAVTQDVAMLISHAHDLGAKAIEVLNRDGSKVAVRWDAEGGEMVITPPPDPTKTPPTKPGPVVS